MNNKKKIKPKKRLRNESLFAKISRREKEIKKLVNTNSFFTINHLGNKVVDTMCNGDKPYRLVLNKDTITIYKLVLEQYNSLVYTEQKLKTITNFIGLWIGFDSTYNEMHGNTVLIMLTSKKYMFVGCNICTFTTQNEIIDYVSPLGNNDVPYPVAYDNDNVYFMMENVYVPRDELLTPMTIVSGEEIFSEFYGHIGGVKHNGIPLKNLRIVHNSR